MDCFVHCLRILAVWWPDAQSTRDNHLLACNCAKYSPIYFFSPADNNKSFLIWLLTTPPHLKYVATLPCNSSFIACFLTLTFHKVVWRRYASAGASYDLVSVCLSVCVSQVRVLSKRMNESSCFSARELRSTYPTPSTGNSGISLNNGTSL